MLSSFENSNIEDLAGFSLDHDEAVVVETQIYLANSNQNRQLHYSSNREETQHENILSPPDEMDHVTRVKWNSGKGTRVCRLNVAVVLFFFVTQHCLDVYCSVLTVKPCPVSLLWLAAVLDVVPALE